MLAVNIAVLVNERSIQFNDLLKIAMIACDSTLQGDSEHFFILIEDLIDSGRCHSVRLTAHKEIGALRATDLKILADGVYRFIIQVYGTVLIAFANDIDLFGNQVHVLQFEINTLRPTYAGVGVQGHDREVTFAAAFEESLAECLYIFLLNSTGIGILNLHLHKIILQDGHLGLASGADQKLIVCPQGKEVIVD